MRKTFPSFSVLKLLIVSVSLLFAGCGNRPLSISPASVNTVSSTSTPLPVASSTPLPPPFSTPFPTPSALPVGQENTVQVPPPANAPPFVPIALVSGAPLLIPAVGQPSSPLTITVSAQNYPPLLLASVQGSASGVNCPINLAQTQCTFSSPGTYQITMVVVAPNGAITAVVISNILVLPPPLRAITNVFQTPFGSGGLGGPGLVGQVIDCTAIAQGRGSQYSQIGESAKLVGPGDSTRIAVNFSISPNDTRTQGIVPPGYSYAFGLASWVGGTCNSNIIASVQYVPANQLRSGTPYLMDVRVSDGAPGPGYQSVGTVPVAADGRPDAVLSTVWVLYGQVP